MLRKNRNVNSKTNRKQCKQCIFLILFNENSTTKHNIFETKIIDREYDVKIQNSTCLLQYFTLRYLGS